MHLSAAIYTAALLLGGSHLIIKDISKGTGPGAKKGDTVTVTYVGKLTNGHIFDSTKLEGGEPFKVKLGEGRVIPGWEQGLLGMKVKGHRRLTIPPELAYGPRGAGTAVPPNATLIFDITMLKIERGGK